MDFPLLDWREREETEMGEGEGEVGKVFRFREMYGEGGAINMCVSYDTHILESSEVKM